jgi:uncharacterized protein
MNVNLKVDRKSLIRYGAWLFLANALFSMIISFRYAKYLHLESEVLAWVYMVVAVIGHFSFLTILPYLCLFIPVVLVFPRKYVAITTAVFVYSLGLCLLLLDTIVFDLYRFHFNRFTFEMIFGGAASQVFVFDIRLYLKAFVFVILVVIIELLLARFIYHWYFKGYLKKVRYIFLGVVLFNIFTHGLHAWADASYHRSILQASRFFPQFYPLKANKFLYRTGIVDPAKERESLSFNDNTSKYLIYPRKPIVAEGNHPSYNILFVVIDSWHYKQFEPETTPNLKLFGDSSLIFTNHYSGSNGTRGGIFSLFYAIPALYWYDVEAAQVGPVFVQELIKKKYQFGIFASASLKNPPFERTVFRSIPDLNTEVKEESVLNRDKQITHDWLDFTNSYVKQNKGQPFFGFLFYDLPHAMLLSNNYKGPFNPSWQYADYLALKNETPSREFINLYKNCVFFDDSLIGLVIKDLKAKKLMDNTVVVVTGDHGQEFNDNHKNYWGHNGNYTRAQIGVPLIVHWPGLKHALYDYWTTHYDIVPTLMQNILGVKNKIDDYSIGKNLFDNRSRTWHVAGSRDHFGIILRDKMITVSYNSSFEITDLQLNELKNATMDVSLVKNILDSINVYYQK